MINKKLMMEIAAGIIIFVIIAIAAVFAYNYANEKSPKGKTVPVTANPNEPFPPTGVWGN